MPLSDDSTGKDARTTEAQQQQQQQQACSRSPLRQALEIYGCIALWIALSASVILVNKYVLAYCGFPYPIALTMTHMGLCSVLAACLVKGGLAEVADVTTAMYIRCILPISILFSGTLWLGNAAYLYLSVSFIQMIKASMPLAVYTAGCFFGTETFDYTYATIMIVVMMGVGIASYGEFAFHLLGFLLQVGSIVTESIRLCLVQILLQKNGIKLNPISTLYHVAPPCFACLMLPFCIIELPKMAADPTWTLVPGWILLSAGLAFGLNLSVFLLIGKSSALTMNIAGVVKDWMLIILSVLLFGSMITGLQLGGYALAFLAVCAYNYQKMNTLKQGGGPSPKDENKPKAHVMEHGDKRPLLSTQKSDDLIKSNRDTSH